MEELNAVQTLNPPAKSRLPHLPLLRRSSHLDSASYRTLVRIFSFCLDESFICSPESREDPRPIFGAEIYDPSCEIDFTFDQSNGGAFPVELGHGCSGNRSPSLHVALSHNLGLDEKLGNEKWGNCEAVNGLMSESSKLQFGVDEGQALDRMVELCHQQADSGLGVDRVQKGVYGSILGVAGGLHSKVGDAQSGNTPCLDSDIQIVETIGKSEERNKDILEAKEVNRTRTEDFELKTFTNSTELLGGKVNGDTESVKDSITYLSTDKLLVVQPQEDMSNSTNESVEKHQETLLDSSTNTSVQEQLHKNLLDSLPHSNSTNEPVEKHQETLLDSSIERLVQEQYHKSLLDSLLGSDSEEVEEGQIPGDFWNSDDFGSLVTHQNNLHEGQKTHKISDWSDILNKEGPDCLTKPLGITDSSGENIFLSASNLNMDNHYAGVDEDNITDDLNLDDIHLNVELKGCHNVPLVDANKHEVALPTLTLDEENTICQNAGKVGPKRKRGALTEERKAQKKKAKRRKRAEKEREQGVKRLKLPPVVKPKAVKLCNFYMVGRCQQGDLCKFSHDATPHTKSQPCKYFACDSCLRGDECPFDHELSKYPCHNFQSKGTCHRGDTCKFSHKIVDVEGSSLPDARKLVSPSTAENLNAGIQNCMNKNHGNANAPAKTIISSTTRVLSKNLEVNSGSAKKPMKMPKGISFITLGNGLSNTNKLANSLLPEKSMRNEENPAMTSKEGHKNTDCLTAKPFVKPQNGSSIFLPKKSIAGESLISVGACSSSATTSMSKALQNEASEASEASKILEEFLFGASG